MRMIVSPPGTQLSAELRIDSSAQVWRDGDHEGRQQHGQRRSHRQAPETLDVKTKEGRADHESGERHKAGEPQPSVTHRDPRLPQMRLAGASPERHRTAIHRDGSVAARVA